MFIIIIVAIRSFSVLTIFRNSIKGMQVVQKGVQTWLFLCVVSKNYVNRL